MVRRVHSSRKFLHPHTQIQGDSTPNLLFRRCPPSRIVSGHDSPSKCVSASFVPDSSSAAPLCIPLSVGSSLFARHVYDFSCSFDNLFRVLLPEHLVQHARAALHSGPHSTIYIDHRRLVNARRHHRLEPLRPLVGIGSIVDRKFDARDVQRRRILARARPSWPD
jgi:hypothetical protein